jgi:hypothetical protein
MGILMPKIKTPPLPKTPTSTLDTAVVGAPEDAITGYKSLTSTTPTGLARKAFVTKKTLLGGIR